MKVDLPKEALSIYISTNGKRRIYGVCKDNFLMDFTKRSDTCDIYFEYKKEWWIYTSGGRREAYRAFLSVHQYQYIRAFGGNYENYNKDKMKPLNIGDWGVVTGTSNENCI